MKNPRTLSRIIIAMLFTLCCNFAFAASAGGSWDEPNDAPYSGNGGGFGGSGASGDWNSSCSNASYSLRDGSTTSSGLYACKAQVVAAYRFATADNALGYEHDSTNTHYKCLLNYPYDGATIGWFPMKCNNEPKKCESPNILVDGVCMPPIETPDDVNDEVDKKCGVGYKLVNGKCVKDTKPCDPAVQNCDEDGNAKCDCCSKLDAIISNQNTQIEQTNTTNQSLLDILNQQQSTNQKVDEVNQKLATLNQLASALKVDTTAINQNIKTMLNNDKTQADKINKALGDIINLLKNNKTYDDTQLRKMLAKALYELPDELEKPYLASLSASATDLTKVTDNQDEQTDLLSQIRDLLVGKPNEDDEKQQPPDPNAPEPEHEQKPEIDPWAAIKGFDISQNKINAIKQCPTPKSFVLANNTFNFDFSYLCQFLSALSPIFLALAYFKGAAVIVGSWGD